jgi:hypothetical protein
MQKVHVLARIGLVLLRIQAAEHVILLCLTYVFANSSAEWDKLYAKDEATRKQTLGFFLKELRKRVAINNDFDEVLAKFLSMRNIFAHRLPDAPGWDMETEEGLAAAQMFLVELDETTDHVGKVFHALVRHWESHNGIESTDSDHPYFKEVDDSYLKILPMFFGPKAGGA